MIPAARHHRTPLHASWPPFRNSISARAPSSERWRCSTRLLVVVYNGHNCAAAVVCRENNGRIAQRWQPEPGTAPTRALSAPLASARGRLDRSRTVQGSLSLLFPDGWQVNRGKQSEAERLQQKLAERTARRSSSASVTTGGRGGSSATNPRSRRWLLRRSSASGSRRQRTASR